MTLQGLRDWVASDAQLWRCLPSGDVADTAIGGRDEPEAEQAWLREHEAVQELWRKASAADAQLVREIAKLAFTKAFAASQHHEMAAQVSDDLRLLAEAALVGYKSPTLERLWGEYSEGQFPRSMK